MDELAASLLRLLEAHGLALEVNHSIRCRCSKLEAKYAAANCTAAIPGLLGHTSCGGHPSDGHASESADAGNEHQTVLKMYAQDVGQGNAFSIARAALGTTCPKFLQIKRHGRIWAIWA